MDSAARKLSARLNVLRAPGMHVLWPLALLSGPVAYPEEPAKSQLPASNRGANNEQSDASRTPLDAYRRYLNAVKKNDLAGATDCWRIGGKESAGALDIVAGIWVELHRFNGAMGKLDKDAEQFIRADCTDAAIERTLARLEHSEVVVTNDRAKLTIRSAKEDGYPNPAFGFSDEPINFRKTDAGWKIDAGELTGTGKPQDFFIEAGGSLVVNRELIDDIVAGVESGKIKSAADVVHQAEKRLGSLEGRIPFTKTVIYEEGTPARYLRIKKGNPDVLCVGPEQLPQRKDIKYLRKVEGDVEAIFQETHGISHPRIVVETQNEKGYEVVYDPDDSKALEIVAKQLGMTVGEEEREILALRITVAKAGHRLTPASKPDKPQWDSSVMDATPGAAQRHWVYPLHGVTMDELAMFLERQFRRPVVNMTGLPGYFSLDVSDQSVRHWPQTLEETQPLDHTGLEFHWQRTKTRVLAVKDSK